MLNDIAQPLKTAKLAKPKTNTPPKRQSNDSMRTREYLTSTEITHLINSMQRDRFQQRNQTLLLLMFRHALRVSEAVTLKWEQVDFVHSRVHVKRIKNGLPSIHPLSGQELRALRQLQRDNNSSHSNNRSYVFISQRGTPLTARSVRHIVAQAGRAAGFEMPIHAHMLRHSTGFYLANKGHDTRAIQQYMGHKNIQNTVRYTELSPDRFKDFWDD